MYIKKANYSRCSERSVQCQLFLNTANVHKKSELQRGGDVGMSEHRCSLILLMYIKKANYSSGACATPEFLLFLNTANVHKKSELQQKRRSLAFNLAVP